MATRRYGKTPRKSSAPGVRHLSTSQFAYPKQRAYPIDTPARARAALAYAARSTTRGTRAHVAAAVKRKYPDMQVGGVKRAGRKKQARARTRTRRAAPARRTVARRGGARRRTRRA